MPDLKEALDSTQEIKITVTGRKTGRKISLPVWFVRDGMRLLLLPVKGSRSNWYKNVMKTPTVNISASGTKATVKARPTRDSSMVKQVVEKFKTKYGAGDVRKYYTQFDACVEIALSLDNSKSAVPTRR